MFFVLKEFVVALLLALVVSVSVVGIIVVLARSTYSRYELASPKPILILGLTLILLFAESLFLFGAVRLRRQIDRAWQGMSLTLQQAQAAGQGVSQEQMAAMITQQVPGAEEFLEAGRQGGAQIEANAALYYREVRSEVKWYIIKRLLWILGFTLVGGGLMIHDASRSARYAASWSMYNLDDI